MTKDKEDVGAVVVGQIPSHLVARQHIKKRALRNKALSVGFNDKDLRDFVTGFHKRKKKRRKEAERQLQEKDRRKRIEARKKRKLERQSVHGGAFPVENPPGSGSGPDEGGSGPEEDDLNIAAPVSETKMYESGDTMITVTTSELAHEDDPRVTHATPKPSDRVEQNHSLPVKKKPLKRVAKQKPRKKPRKLKSQKKEKRKGRNK